METFSETLFCTTCSRQFQRKHAFETHVQCCPKLLTMDMDMDECDESQLPSQSKLYAMILELNKKCIKMQNEIRTLKVYEIKEKKPSIIMNGWRKIAHKIFVGKTCFQL